MDEHNTSKEINALTGDYEFYQAQLLFHLKVSISRAKKIDIIVSFLKKSGVEELRKQLEWAVGNNIPIRILTGTYLGITEPAALYYLRDVFGYKIDIHFFTPAKHSFHPKAYLFETDVGKEMYIGSSNISRGALTSSIEWNYRITEEKDSESIEIFSKTFNDLFYNHSISVTDEVLSSYSKSWKANKFYSAWKENYKKADTSDSSVDSSIELNEIKPRDSQIEALYKLRTLREQGFTKALVIAATGIGKTYLAAFDSKTSSRILFIAHREEIIKQAAISFNKVRGDNCSGLFYGSQKDKDKPVICALVETLGRKEYLNENYFPCDYFDYIVIDEFHHAVASNYKRLIEYFKPKFLLGLTATPERMDGQDIYSICDFNIAYEIRLQEAINKGWLSAFDYYGIYDDTVEYKNISYSNGKYNSSELEKALMINKRSELVINHYKKYSTKKALGFCSSIAHADFMAKSFCNEGIPSCSVHSGKENEFTKSRDVAIKELQSGKIKVIFSVDMFNEGVDIPSVDTILFLRPTESPTIFLQQLGRGLRLSNEKSKVIVLDFIGNYKKAGMIPYLLKGKPYTPDLKNKKTIFDEADIPDNCHIDFDFQIIDIFKQQALNSLKFKDIVQQNFNNLIQTLGRVPSRVEFYNNLDNELLRTLKSNPKENPLKDWIGYLDKQNKLSENEENIFIKTNSKIPKDFINLIENTGMTKSYKMPVFLAFYNGGKIKTQIDDDDIYKSFFNFYHQGTNKVDMLRDNSTKDFLTWNKQQYLQLAKKNPINFLQKTNSNYFYTNSSGAFCLNKELLSVAKSTDFSAHFIDSINYRILDYYERFNNK